MDLYAEPHRVTAAKEEIWLPAAAWRPRNTNGAAEQFLQLATNAILAAGWDFDASVVQYLQTDLALPKRWNAGTLSFRPFWSHPATTTNFGVAFRLAAHGYANDDALDAAMGTGQLSIDTGGTTRDLYIGPESSAITIAGSVAAGNLIKLELSRQTADAGDTMAVNATLHGVMLTARTTAFSDE